MSGSKESASTRAGWGKEMEAKAPSSLKWVWGLNTGFNPKSSRDIDKTYCCFWEGDVADQWVQYDFPKPVTLSESGVYWLNLDQYNGNYPVPESWSLMVQDARKRWVNVEAAGPYGLELDTYNTVTFKSIRTTAIRMNVKLQKDNLAGMLAWKVK
jgi:uncharacterized protein